MPKIRLVLRAQKKDEMKHLISLHKSKSEKKVMANEIFYIG